MSRAFELGMGIQTSAFQFSEDFPSRECLLVSWLQRYVWMSPFWEHRSWRSRESEPECAHMMNSFSCLFCHPETFCYFQKITSSPLPRWGKYMDVCRNIYFPDSQIVLASSLPVVSLATWRYQFLRPHGIYEPKFFFLGWLTGLWVFHFISGF